ncbi:MAG: TonB family protein [Sphingomonadales bacterium]
MIALGIAAVLHIFLAYAFISGLAMQAIKQLANKVEAVNIKEEAPPPEEPPPPPPKEMEIPPYVPPPDVTVAQDAAPTITVQQAVPQPEPPRYVAPAPAPPAPAGPPPSRATDKGRNNNISTDDYPDASRRAEEEGVVRVRFVIDTTGKVSACEVAQTSGFPRLDDATCKIIIRRWRYNPATQNGQPVAETKVQAVRWKLVNG